MQVENYKCDCCGMLTQAEDYGSPTGWVGLRVSTDDKKNFYEKTRDICLGCANKTGLTKAMSHIAHGTKAKSEQK